MLDGAAQAVLARILHDTDDLVRVPIVGIRLGHMKTDRVPAREEAFRKRLVDQAHHASAGPILLGDLAAQQDGNTKRREVSRTDRVVPGSIVVAARRRVALDDDLVAVVASAKEAVVRVGHGANARHHTNAHAQVLERVRLPRDVVAGGLRVDPHRLEPILRVPEIDILKVDERANEEARADQQW